ncbi:MAG TPA: hypothetical protein VFO16_24170 [Pseudonocardiaceae bacterium]|nr:hypothetical protein [Pseudonocardiaceae bacterium]
MKNVNGIQTVFDNAICPVPTPGGGVGVKDVGGVTIPDGQKGTTGEMPEVSGFSLPDDNAPGRSRPDIPGS